MADKGLTTSKGRRQNKNKHYYEVMPVKVAARKKKRAARATETKKQWIKRDLKKNGKPVKGGATDVARRAAIGAQTDGSQGSDENSDHA